MDLYDLDYKGCHGCLGCKLKTGKHPGCVWKDELSPLINHILEADNLIIGTPIYYGEPTAQFRAFMERLVFCVAPYDTGTYFNGSVKIGFIYTMNAPQNLYEQYFRSYLSGIEGSFGSALHGETRSYAACDTWQTKDYSRYDMEMFDGNAKKAHHDEQFPLDLQEAFKMGAEMNQ